MKRYVEISVKYLLVLSIVVSSFIIAMSNEVCARSSISVKGNSYQQYIECRLQDTSRAGSIMIIMYPTKMRSGSYSVCMKDERGRVIWSEQNAISWNGRRTFYLGNNHKVYRIYIKGNGGSGTVATASTTSYNNVRVI